MDFVLGMSATSLSRGIKAGDFTSREVVDAYIAAIERVNPRLNAVVAKRFVQARAEADDADRLLRDEGCEQLGVFHGVPCTIKESMALAGMPNTAGLVARRGHAAVVDDAVAVARLRAAGAIPLGVTNTSELCMWMESSNAVYGRTNNPYDQGRIAGGSSGGEGAIVGAGASPMGLGSDIGGSIRMPAFFCGVFGHKSTGGVVPATGQHPKPEGDALRYMTTGPLVRCSEDLFPFLKTIAGPDAGDPQCSAWELGDPAKVDLTKLRLLNVEDNGTTPVSAELRAAQRRAAERLEGLGMRVETLQVPEFKRSLEIWGAMLEAASETSFASLLGEGEPIAVGRELLRWTVGRSPHTLPALGLALIEKVPLLTGARGERLIEDGKQLQRKMEALLGDDGIMLFPPYASVAPKHGQPLATPFRWVYTAIINVLELPATQVPLGLDEAGLPLGVQVIARRGNDHLTIATAQWLEHEFGGWVRPAK